ncbi:hypothetical protein BamMEX5DRAFT_2783 [Burkholderia ambifaria MEX-5]|uniref:Uncharacterized protein n=2 Tax=Burkholderia ambifaria TaxID=152480 RepID=B1T4R7_9BURK|nr:hypothetical protein BamMEX5DRAFT_2783 [Burkholderia ambifaria MEX-5]
MAVTTLFQTVPQFAVAVTIVAVLGASLESTIVAIAAVSLPAVARLVRGEFIGLAPSRGTKRVKKCSIRTLSLSRGESATSLPSQKTELSCTHQPQESGLRAGGPRAGQT